MKKKIILFIILVFIISAIIFLCFGPITFLNIHGELTPINVSSEIIEGENVYNEVENTIFLGRMTNLKELWVDCFNNTDVSFLNNMPELTELTLFCSNFSPESVNDLSSLDNLTSLYIYGQVDKNSDFVSLSVFLSKTPNVSKLHLESRFTDFSGIEKLSKLQNFYAYGGTDELPDLTPLTELPDLEIICLDTFCDNQDFSPLCKCPNLKELNIRINNINELESIDTLAQLNSFKIDNLSENKIIINDNTNLSSCENVSKLELNNFDVETVTKILELPNLKELYLYNSFISRENINLLKSNGIKVIYK